jgi:hypothetical protein
MAGRGIHYKLRRWGVPLIIVIIAATLVMVFAGLDWEPVLLLAVIPVALWWYTRPGADDAEPPLPRDGGVPPF